MTKPNCKHAAAVAMIHETVEIGASHFWLKLAMSAVLDELDMPLLETAAGVFFFLDRGALQTARPARSLSSG